MYSDYVLVKINDSINSISNYIINKYEWNKIKKDILLLNMIIERRVNIGIMAQIIFSNINQKNKTILRKYNVQSKIKLDIEEIKLLKKYIIAN